MKKKITVLVTGVLLLVSVFLFFTIQFPFLHTNPALYHTVKGFYEEETKLDAVYIGSSSTYAFFQAPLAWHEYGITVYPFAIMSMPMQAVKYAIEEARKTQPDALYIINLNLIKKADNKIRSKQIHYLADFMPLSVNKINMVNDLCTTGKIPLQSRLEYFLPIIRYHSKWSGLTSDDFFPKLNRLKAGQTYTGLLTYVNDISSEFLETDTTLPLSEKQTKVFNDLLDYLDEKKLKVLFVLVPQAISDESILAQINKSVEILKERGYPCLNMFPAADEIGLDLTRDHYNNNHTNIHGSLKYTNYFGKYLVDQYGFEDKRGDPEYAAWDKAYDNYIKEIKPYLLDFELKHAQRDLSLPAPVIKSLKTVSDGFSLSWSAVDEADGYVIYRKAGNGNWKAVNDVGSGVTDITDSGLKKRTNYTYVVVPYRIVNGTKAYGSINIAGKSGKTASG